MTKKVITSNLSQLSKAHQRNAKRLPAAIERGYAVIAKESIVMYQKTTRTWRGKPYFFAKRTARGVTILVDSWIYALIDFGSTKTGTYPIVARNAKALHFFGPYRAATKPRVIGSIAAKVGNDEFFRRKVMHPYMKPRHFTDEITKRMQKRAANIMRQQLKDAINVEAVGL